METLTGKTLQGGKYILGEELGRGGFGITYKATHLHLNQTVVIKTLSEALRSNPLFPDSQQKFQDEARRLALCTHPNIVRVSDFFLEHDCAYMVMDYVPGQTLDKAIAPDRPLPETLAVHYIRQISEALKVVHQNGLLHRDIKPQNMILRQGTQEVVLIDFGIAREFEGNVTQTHTSLISSGYAPIEQYLPQAKRTPATDIYALAATLYALLTAKTPLPSILRCQLEARRSEEPGHSQEITAALTENSQPMPTPRQVRPELSPAVDRAVMLGMALEASHRPASIEAWLALLSECEGGTVVIGCPPGAIGCPPGATETVIAPSPPNLLATTATCAPEPANSATGSEISPQPGLARLVPLQLLKARRWLVAGGLALVGLAALGVRALSPNAPSATRVPTSAASSPTSASSPVPSPALAAPGSASLPTASKPARTPAIAPALTVPENSPAPPSGTLSSPAARSSAVLPVSPAPVPVNPSPAFPAPVPIAPPTPVSGQSQLAAPVQREPPPALSGSGGGKQPAHWTHGQGKGKGRGKK